MLDRRSFLERSLLATATGIYSPLGFERIAPKWLCSDQQSFHPISPERTITISENSAVPRLPRPWQLQRRGLAPAKIDLILQLMDVLTGFYCVPHLFPSWSVRLARREVLASTGMDGFALLHQFQDRSQVRLASAPVDWWLFLFPGGMDWEALDGEPVHGMIGHVFPAGHRSEPGLALCAYVLTGIAERRINWQHVIRLDRHRAAIEVNRALSAAWQLCQRGMPMRPGDVG